MPLTTLTELCSDIIVYREMNTVAPSTSRVKRLRERRSKGVAMVAPVEVGERGIDLLASRGLLPRSNLWKDNSDGGNTKQGSSQQPL